MDAWRKRLKRARDWGLVLKFSAQHPTGERLIVLGDSHARAQGASNRMAGYVGQLSRLRSLPAYGLGEGGAGILAGSDVRPRRDFFTCLPQLRLLRPTSLYVQLSANDRFWPSHDVTSAWSAFLARVRPAAVIGPLLHPERDQITRLRLIAADVTTALGLVYIDPTGWVDNDTSFLAPDGAHLNDLGHEVLATKLDAVLH
jgi:lysophospholipase L1-like esterase